MQPQDQITQHFRLAKAQQQALKKLGVTTLADLLYHFPARYETVGNTTNINGVHAGDHVTLYGTLSKLKTKKGFRSRIPMAEGFLSDQSGRIKIVWFHQPYLAKMLPEGTLVRADGKVGDRKGELYLSNPDIERATALPQEVSPMFGKETGEALHPIPIYPESRGVTSRWFYYTIQKILAGHGVDMLEDPIPDAILKRYNLPSLKTALVWIHAPHTETESMAARKRFAFEEVFLIQLRKHMDRAALQQMPAWPVVDDAAGVTSFLSRFSFTPTEAQQKAIKEILSDFKKPYPMSRLLEGDVGSGKTFVAAATAYAVVMSRPTNQTFGNLQVAYMAPTEILAKQHFASFIENFSHLPIQIGLITGSGCKKFPSKVNPKEPTDISRPQLMKWVKNGEIPILFGTHALIQKSVSWKHLAYVIIDEQHRFGTNQRRLLAQKSEGGRLPHLLSMTATPIPRTLALTLYGDLDLTLLDELPAGRKPIITDLVTPAARAKAYEAIRQELKAGRQAYVICPRIDEPDPEKENALYAKSVTEEARRLKKDVFPEYTIGILHSKMSTNEKEKIMRDFTEHRITILVATSVVEVGVNVPNATVIIIEGAERFGLAQLHQLRGRVLRSTHQAYCYIFTESKAKQTLARLKALRDAKSGFELAELDLGFRGAGELYGRKQWGISDVGMEAIKNLKLVEAARAEAAQLIEKDPELKKQPLLKTALKENEPIHFE